MAVSLRALAKRFAKALGLPPSSDLKAGVAHGLTTTLLNSGLPEGEVDLELVVAKAILSQIK